MENSAMSPQCPRCQTTIVIEGKPPRDVVCPSCGSSVELDVDATIDAVPDDIGRSRKTSEEDFALKVLEKFELLVPLGSGSFGSVYKARDSELDRLVAIKIPRAGSDRKILIDSYARPRARLSSNIPASWRCTTRLRSTPPVA